MHTVKKTYCGVVLLTLLIGIPVFAQSSDEPAKGQTVAPESAAQSQNTQPQQAAGPTSNDYVFPSSDKRLKRYGRSMFGPFSLLRVAGSAAINQWKESPDEWEQGASGYGKRFASELGRNAIRQTVTYGLSEALRLDTGFERSKHKEFGPRLRDALVQNVTSRTRSGKRVLSVPILTGAYVAPVIAAETWYPARYSYKDGLRAGSYSLAAGFAINVIREFVFSW